MKTIGLLLPALALCACAVPAQLGTETETMRLDAGAHRALHAIEERSGGRLGVVLIDGDGNTLIDYRGDQRFAFCSAFKLALGGAALVADAKGSIDLDREVRFTRADFVGHQPYVEQRLDGEAGVITLGDALDGTLLTSDNVAANMLIDALGGPPAVTAIWRSWGDTVSRLDRRETALNENRAGDDRDTSSPLAMAETVRLLLDGDVLEPVDEARLAGLLARSRTGLERVRAGLLDGWRAGDKTGTCKPSGMPDPQANDIGFFVDDSGETFWFAVMLDRYDGDVASASAMHAEVGAIFADVVRHPR
ncbi:class A beta-lactamase [Sphingomicrobium sp. XHP0235]|uniref:class A beta-lactamase n=1 Tax=Sphingomicrobium aquimarinum TaxID=3133971 RepID=UPI0031FF0C2A